MPSNIQYSRGIIFFARNKAERHNEKQDNNANNKAIPF